MGMLTPTGLTRKAACQLEFSKESWTPGARRAQLAQQRLVSPPQDESRTAQQPGVEPQQAALTEQKSVPAREAADADLAAQQQAEPQQAW
jgi:hypothetical protein